MTAYARNPQTIPDDSVGGSSVREGVAEQNNVAINDLFTALNAHANNEDGRSHVEIDEALDAVGDVSAAVDDAQTAQAAAETARDKAEQWADNPEDVAVETGAYSAKHHALKAAASAAEAESFLVDLPLSINQGGTGAQTAEDALEALGAEPADADILKRDVSAILTKGFPAAPAAMVTTGPTPATGALQTIDTSGGAVSLAAPAQAGVIRFIVTGGNELSPSASYDSIDGAYDTGIGLAQGEIVSDGTNHFLTIINGVGA
jgi:hypothetical protein